MSAVTIKQLFYYPIKSCGGIQISEAQLTASGFQNDRRWMVVDAGGMFVTQRERPELALVLPRISDGALSLVAPAMETFTMPVDTRSGSVEVEIFGERYQARAVSESADAWFSEYLKAPHKLVAFDDQVLRKGGVQYPKRDEAPTLFPDNYGLLVLSEASLADLNQRLPEGVPIDRFRPNIVVSGLNAYEEDYLQDLKVGEMQLRFVDLCFRCNLTTIDQNTARFGEEPLKTLMSYRVDPSNSGVKFGAYFSVEEARAGHLRVGDEVSVNWSF